jgi:REP element-mobilizing transposase RayT
MRALHSDYEEYRSWPRWYYHMTFDSLEKGQLFNDDGEYAHGMNGVAIGQYIYNLSIVAFNLMINHCHILAHGSGEDLVKFFIFMKRRLNDRLRDDGHPTLPGNYGFKLVKVEGPKQLVDTIIYIARNPVKACPKSTASGYMWGSTNLIFNEMRNIYEKKRLKELSRDEKRTLFRSAVTLPDNYCYNEKYGFILPESYVLTEKAEEMLGNSWIYSYRIIRDIDGFLKITEGLGEEVILSEDELNGVISQTLKTMFKVNTLNELGADDRCRLAMVLKNKYKVTVKRIARKLHIDVSTLNRLFE